MLPSLLIRRFVVPVIVAGACSLALAQPQDDAKASAESADVLAKFPSQMGSGISAEERQRLQELARELTRTFQQASEAAPLQMQESEAFARQQRRRADTIADETLAQQRNEALEFLGLDPEESSALFYFVSWSMPLELLRSYVVDAMWAGGTLVFRGVPPGYDMAKFITGPMRELVYDKGAFASLSIDPRLFEIYKVGVVPTIVYTNDLAHPECGPEIKHTFTAGKQQLQYSGCHAVKPESYWKMSGAVSSDYALRSFIGEGAQGARRHHEALARGMKEGATSKQEQTPFSGNWIAVPLPDDAAAREAASTGQPANASAVSTQPPSR